MSEPSTRALAGTWDCHAHVFEDRRRYPLWDGREYEPPPAPLEAYLDMLDRRGLSLGVLVQPSAYGFDNRCLLDALDGAGGRLFGVAVPAPGTRPGELAEMHARGVRGVRCNLLNAGGLEPDVVIGWRRVLRALGWHVALQLEVDEVDDLRAFVTRFQLPVVIDHMGRPGPGEADPARPALRQLVELVREGTCFVKLSAPYRLSGAPPPWADVTPLARALLEADPAHCLWASDWPHVHAEARVGEDDIFEALDEWCPDAAARHVIMVQAPRKLLCPG